jgi:hypothetical protein
MGVTIAQQVLDCIYLIPQYRRGSFGLSGKNFPTSPGQGAVSAQIIG